jgi:putative ATP-binding cassette transporter
MRLLRLLAQVSALQFTIAIFVSALGGVCAMGAIICVLESLRSGNILWWEFASVAALSVVIARFSRATLGGLAAKSIVRLRRRLVRSLLRVPLVDLERIGPTRLLVAFTSDLASVGSAVRNLASLFASSAFLLALLAYIGWLSPTIMVVTSLLCVLCIGGAVVLRWLENRHRRSGREAWDSVLHAFNMMLDGVKELQLNRPLARRVLLSFEERVRELRRSSGERARYTDLVGAWIQAMFYVILGTAAFGPFGDNASLRLDFGLLALLQIRRPLLSLVVDSRAFVEASVAFQRIVEVGLTLAKDEHERDGGQLPPASSRGWRSLRFQGVLFRYEDENSEGSFTLGPVEMTLRPGEIVFIAGGNGSGKTTLAKVLTGLYAPTSGTIVFDGYAVDDANIRWYRGRFAAVFADFCLFDGVVDLQRDDLDHEAEQLAIRLKLDRLMLATPESSSKSTAISSGERRRLALLAAIIEDRPVLVLDEWAADQDPHYKDVFYLEILPRMRELGKLVVVITHDDRYFRTADRVLWLERGEPPIWRSPASFAGAPEVVTDPGDRGTETMGIRT